nr:proteasomal ubiquitin receptor ADRM1-like [Leptinotarsa decemlineata]
MPAGGALFGSAAAGPGSTGGNKHLIEVRAGKLNLKGKMVTSDKRKGLLYVYQSEDSLMHFCWQDRTTGVVEDDLIIFPDDCEYVKVPQCTTGRAYLLKFKSSEFDMGPNSGSARTNTTPAITHRTTVPSTPTTTAAANPTTPSAGLTTPQRSIPTAVPDAPKPRTSTRTPDTASPSSFANPIQLSDLQNFLSGLSPPVASADGTQQQSVDLSTALNTETLSGILSSPATLEQLQGHLPAVDGDPQQALRSTLASPQFSQAVSQFSSALESGQLGPIVSQFAVNPEAVAAAAQGNMANFVKALESSGSSTEAGKSAENKDKVKDKTTKKDDKKDDDEHMQLD